MRLIKRPYFNLVSVFSVRWGPNGRFWFLCSLERATKNINLTRRDRETSQLSPALSLLRIHWHEISVMTKFSYCEYSSQVRNAEGKVIMLCRKRRCEDLITQSLIATDVAASKRPWKSMYEANSGVRSCEARKIHLANGKGVWLCTLRWKVENISTSKNPGKCDTRLKTWVCTRCNQRRTMVLLPTCLGEVGCLSQNFCCLFRYGCCFIACAQLTFFPIYLWFCGGGMAVTTRALYDAC